MQHGAEQAHDHDRRDHQQAARREQQLQRVARLRRPDAEEAVAVEPERRVAGEALLVDGVLVGERRRSIRTRPGCRSAAAARRAIDAAGVGQRARASRVRVPRRRVDADDRARDRERVLGRRPPGRPAGPRAASCRAAALARRVLATRSANAANASSAASTWLNRFTANGITSVAPPSVTAVSVPSPGSIRSTTRRGSAAAAGAPAAPCRTARAPTPSAPGSRAARLISAARCGVVAVRVDVEPAVGPLPRAAGAGGVRGLARKRRRADGLRAPRNGGVRTQRQARRLDREEVPVDVRLVARLPVVVVDLSACRRRAP